LLLRRVPAWLSTAVPLKEATAVPLKEATADRKSVV
jgi:hypothetical protein